MSFQHRRFFQNFKTIVRAFETVSGSSEDYTPFVQVLDQWNEDDIPEDELNKFVSAFKAYFDRNREAIYDKDTIKLRGSLNYNESITIPLSLLIKSHISSINGFWQALFCMIHDVSDDPTIHSMYEEMTGPQPFSASTIYSDGMDDYQRFLQDVFGDSIKLEDVMRQAFEAVNNALNKPSEPPEKPEKDHDGDPPR